MLKPVHKQIWWYREELVADNLRLEIPDVRGLGLDFIQTPIENWMWENYTRIIRRSVIVHCDLYRL